MVVQLLLFLFPGPSFCCATRNNKPEAEQLHDHVIETLCCLDVPWLGSTVEQGQTAKKWRVVGQPVMYVCGICSIFPWIDGGHPHGWVWWLHGTRQRKILLRLGYCTPCWSCANSAISFPVFRLSTRSCFSNKLNCWIWFRILFCCSKLRSKIRSVTFLYHCTEIRPESGFSLIN